MSCKSPSLLQPLSMLSPITAYLLLVAEGKGETFFTGERGKPLFMPECCWTGGLGGDDFDFLQNTCETSS